jgi:hypothetical protein
MISSVEILALLDARAEEFDFPVLDNANWRFAAGRVRAFRDGDEWGLTFEILAYYEQTSSFEVDVYAYGPLADGAPGGFVTSVPVIEESPDDPLWGDDGTWLVDGKDEVVLRLNGAPLRIRCARSGRISDHRTLVLAHGDCSDEAAFLRALAREAGLGRLMPDTVLWSATRLTAESEVARAVNWDHPDIAGEELPSESRALRALAQLLSNEVDRFDFDHSNDNTYWQAWAKSPTYYDQEGA